ncbi:MAG: hypothetical protein A3K83_06550, partial [Omnitrophica WOR_2 bacterium RBG_13_44_8b]
KLNLILSNDYNNILFFIPPGNNIKLLHRSIAKLLLENNKRQFCFAEIKNIKNKINNQDLAQLKRLEIIVEMQDSFDAYYYNGISGSSSPIEKANKILNTFNTSREESSSPILETRLFKTYAQERNQLKVLLKRIKKAVIFFGSGRLGPRKPLYNWVVDLAYLAGKICQERGIKAIITGAGPCLMEAVNKGAQKAKVESFGLNIALSSQQEPNRYIDKLLDLRYFFTRKIGFLKKAVVIFVLPGGYGTLNELFECLILKYRGYMNNIPIVLVGKKFYDGLTPVLREIEKRGYLKVRLEDLLCLVNSKQEVVKIINNLPLAPRQNNKRIDDKVVKREFFKAISKLQNFGPALGIVGAHSTTRGSIYWQITKDIARQLTSSGIPLIYFGSTGISEAAWEGSQEAKNHNKALECKTASLFINHDYKKYLDTAEICVNFHYKFVQKTMLIRHAKLGYIFFPGGLETLDALFEVLCLMQTGKIQRAPVILVGREFWRLLVNWLVKTLEPFGVISKEDLGLLQVVDTSREAVKIIKDNLLRDRKSSSPISNSRNPNVPLSHQNFIQMRYPKGFSIKGYARFTSETYRAKLMRKRSFEDDELERKLNRL